MNNKEIEAYLAGIIDGEGCLSIRKTKNKSKAVGGYTDYYKSWMEVGMCHKPVIDFLYKHFGGRCHMYHQKPSGFHVYKPVFYWVVVGKNIRPILERVLPYLIEKKEQAEYLLLFDNLIGKRGQRHSIDNSNERVRLFHLVRGCKIGK